jgi:hypothetical protein
MLERLLKKLITIERLTKKLIIASDGRINA